MTAPGGRRILLTNLRLDGRTGTEIVVRNLAEAFVRRGHRPVVYAPRLGPLAEEIRARAVPVVDDLRQVSGPIDVIHAHHLPSAAAAIVRFPDVPVVFVSHDFRAWHDAPPHFPSVRRYVAVDHAVEDRLRAEGVPADRLRVVLNQPALDRFAPGPPLPATPRRALAFAKNSGHLEAIRRACADRGLALDVAGPVAGRTLDAPERELPAYDVVFASALTAMEAMATGRGVIVCDGRGLAGWVGPAEFDRWRGGNFGLRILTRRVTVEAVARELDRYAPDEAAVVAARLRADGGVEAQVEAFERLHAEAIAEHGAWRADDDAWRRALVDYVQTWSPAATAPHPWEAERARLIEERDTLLTGLAPCRPGATYAVADAAAADVVQMAAGFGGPEPGGRWTCATVARLLLRVPPGAVDLHLRLQPFVTERRPTQRLQVMIDGAILGAWTLDAGDGQRAAEGQPTVVVAVPAARVPAHGLLALDLCLPDAAAPLALGISDDPRLLGVRLVDVRVEPAAPVTAG
jgi:hypothetical protein